ncbi:MAG TPA: M15 family metallopeptidase [Pyrinomonadaceae bacterium]|jgi:hypothetical protein
MLTTKRIYLALIALCALVLLVQTARNARGTLFGAASEFKMSEAVKLRAAFVDSDSSPAAQDEMAAAAAQNSRLKSELQWTFGGKTQRGWQIYTPLISHLIGTDSDAESREFAAALARWQRRTGLKPSGILDKETLSAMITNWQSRRIKDRTYPPPERILTAPASEFWDASRPEELRGVERQAYSAYKRMVAAAVSDSSSGLKMTRNGELDQSEKFLKIVSAFRSKEYQEKLRQASPNAGSAGLAVNSPHFTGRALDLYVGGDPVSTQDANRMIQTRTRIYLWLVRNAEKFGFVPYFYEPWHWEYRGE